MTVPYMTWGSVKVKITQTESIMLVREGLIMVSNPASPMGYLPVQRDFDCPHYGDAWDRALLRLIAIRQAELESLMDAPTDSHFGRESG